MRLSDGCIYRDVVFDGDRYVAVEINERPVYEQPELFEQEVLAFVVTSDYSPGRRFYNCDSRRARRVRRDAGRELLSVTK